jgi:hypothetical protein
MKLTLLAIPDCPGAAALEEVLAVVRRFTSTPDTP